jgi:ribonuclease T1
MLRLLFSFLLALQLGLVAAKPMADVGTIAQASLPPEAVSTLRLIEQGGPFPYAKDGVVFGNREKVLPKQKRGYYREYTVKTPGAKNRGARRIVSGEPKEFYYTDDHYASFKRVLLTK